LNLESQDFPEMLGSLQPEKIEQRLHRLHQELKPVAATRT